MNREERNEKMAAISWVLFVLSMGAVVLFCAFQYIREKWLLFYSSP